jgi:uncharacterized cysteine cluster protein YcgN (CxxCxxCC family)
MMRERFWDHFKLTELTQEEWEALCDGCGRCCLIKLEDEDSGEIAFTGVACKQLNLKTAQCQDYPNRQQRVPDCIQLTPEAVTRIKWLPRSCGYRRVHEGRGLAAWHPLISGDPFSVQKAGIAVIGRVVSESAVYEDDLQDHVIKWVK